jgi:hypothetical protein
MSDTATTAAPISSPITSDGGNAAESGSNSTLPAPKTADVATPPAPPSKIRLAGKVDGQEFAEELTQEELVARYQKMKAADKRLAEAAEQRKQLETKLARLKQNPWDALKEDGLDLRALAIQKLAEEFQAEQLKAQDPKEYEKLQLQRQLEDRDKQIKEYESRVKAEQEAQVVAQARTEIMETYGSALQKTGLPINEETAAKMIEIGIMNLEHGIDLTPEQLAAETRAYFEGLETKAAERVKGRYTSLKGEDLVKELGDDVVKEVQRVLLARARSQIQRPAPVQQSQADSVQPRKVESDTDVKRRLGVW